MIVLNDYTQFNGRHWETGTIHNYYAYRNVCVPQTGRPMSEQLLMGISGGVVFGYFSFAYAGWDPFVAILTRNTFDPVERMLSRLGIMQTVQQTAKADKARKNLLSALDEGTPVIVQADTFSLPYNAHPWREDMWGMLPIVVYGDDGETVYIADRAAVGLTVSAEAFAASRSRVKKTKHRQLLLEAPDWDKLNEAIAAGIWDCIKLFTEKPPKGSKNNFGFLAYQHLAKLLTKPKQKQSWEKVFPAGREITSALTSTLERISTFGQASGGAERHNYAIFLDEAAELLGKPALSDAATIWRRSADAWRALHPILLPDEIDGFGRLRTLISERSQQFITNGNAALGRIQAIDAEMATLKDELAADFPLDAAGVIQHRAAIADHIMSIHDIEREAITLMQHAMTS